MFFFRWHLNIWCVDPFEEQVEKSRSKIWRSKSKSLSGSQLSQLQMWRDEISVLLEDLWVPWWVATAMQNGCTMRRRWTANKTSLSEDAIRRFRCNSFNIYMVGLSLLKHHCLVSTFNHIPSDSHGTEPQVFQKHPADAIRESFSLMGFRQRPDGDWPDPWVDSTWCLEKYPEVIGDMEGFLVLLKTSTSFGFIMHIYI